MPDEPIDRRQQIAAAAARCFARRGFHQTTMPEICREADLSPGTVYRYFRSKEELIEAIVAADRDESLAWIAVIAAAPNVADALDAAIDRAFAEDLDPNYSAVYTEILAEASRNPRVAGLLLEHEASLVGALAGVLRRGQADGDIDATLTAEALAELLSAMIDGLIVHHAVAPDAPTAIDAVALKRWLRGALRPIPAALPGAPVSPASPAVTPTGSVSAPRTSR